MSVSSKVCSSNTIEAGTSTISEIAEVSPAALPVSTEYGMMDTESLVQRLCVRAGLFSCQQTGAGPSQRA